MFIETRAGKTVNNTDITLAFAKSTNVYAFPCGRRRSSEVDQDGNLVNTKTDKYYFPFDPEARLNTEANNRKHSSLNGFTQTYLKDWDNDKKLLTLSLAGYLFKIALSTVTIKTTATDHGTNQASVIETEIDYCDINNFGNGILAAIRKQFEAALDSAKNEEDRNAAENAIATINSATAIYANIVIEDVHLFSGFQEYFTGILRNQTDGDLPATSLDLLKTAAENMHDYIEARNFDNYFFSGLSFSTVPLTGAVQTRSCEPVTVQIDSVANKTVERLVVSLRILERDTSGSEWKIHQPALLPKIDHGTTEDSIIIYGNATVKGNDKKLTVEGTAEITGDTDVRSNLTVDDNINVGNPTTAATGNNGGCIVAKNNITAEQNLVAGQNLTVGGTAEITGNTTVTGDTTIKSSLAVGPTVAPDTANAGTITAETHVETPTLNASTSITTPSAAITSATITTAEVKDTATINTAIIDTATITSTTTTDDLTVKTKATVEEADIETANIDTLTGDDATIGTIKSDDIQQKITETYRNVPVIFVEKQTTSGHDEYQLQIVRANKINF